MVDWPFFLSEIRYSEFNRHFLIMTGGAMTDQEIIVQVCSTCGACEADIMSELARLKERSSIALRVQMEECLDTCESEPSFAVDGVSIAPASPGKLRRAVEMAVQNRRSSAGDEHS